MHQAEPSGARLLHAPLSYSSVEHNPLLKNTKLPVQDYGGQRQLALQGEPLRSTMLEKNSLKFENED